MDKTKNKNMVEQDSSVAIYETIKNEYEHIISSYTDEEKRIAEKIRNIIYNQDWDVNTITSTITKILVDENQNIEILSKIAPIILLEEDEKNKYSYFSRSRYNFFDILLETNLINPNYLFSNGSTLLHILTVLDKWEIEKLVELAVKHNYNVNQKDNNGNTVLHLAISSPHRTSELLDMLLALGKNFNYNSVNNMGYSIFDYYLFIKNNITAKNSEYPYWYINLKYVDEDVDDRMFRSGIFRFTIESIIGKDKACFIEEKFLVESLNEINFKVNRLYEFLKRFECCEYKKYEINENDSCEQLRNQIDYRKKEFIQLEEIALSILEECFFDYAKDVLSFITNSDLNNTFLMIYNTLLAGHHHNINSEYFRLPYTPDTFFMIFIYLFNLEFGHNKVLGDNIAKKLRVTRN